MEVHGRVGEPQNDPTHISTPSRIPRSSGIRTSADLPPRHGFLWSVAGRRRLNRTRTRLRQASGKAAVRVEHGSLELADWQECPQRAALHMDTVPGFGGYKCAPGGLLLCSPKPVVLHLQTSAGLQHQRDTDDPSLERAAAVLHAGHSHARLPIDFIHRRRRALYLFFNRATMATSTASRTTYADFPKASAVRSSPCAHPHTVFEAATPIDQGGGPRT